jgi:hypothetical protein
LGEQYQELIRSWQKQNQAKLHEADEILKKLFKLARLNQNELDEHLTELSDAKLSEYFLLMDAADICAYGISETVENSGKRQNLVRHFFEEYHGQNSKAYRFVCLVPEQMRTKLVSEVANKRLGWILDHLGHPVRPESPFDDCDIQLFHNSRLLEVSSDFNFANVVLTHPAFHGKWNSAMETFLKACKQACLDSGGLSNKYVQKNKNIKPFVLNMCKLSSDAQTQSMVNIPTHLSPKSREAIRV